MDLKYYTFEDFEHRRAHPLIGIMQIAVSRLTFVFKTELLFIAITEVFEQLTVHYFN